ncbi:hypothetical protein BOTBODRAFT_54552 [Botryobasidium botryosum FD-172 SS1]|uniref:Uncharacterized protein n=1 Tax=Botryobasidium botryosum (strain FD-172 SS1) TaxID=930990 RepID=A0A067MVS4_BOTB1|nr:hypothetical protein BOTBODRAFT_54552 [Botryobasidium botryosum FD-172 SS1]
MTAPIDPTPAEDTTISAATSLESLTVSDGTAPLAQQPAKKKKKKKSKKSAKAKDEDEAPTEGQANGKPAKQPKQLPVLCISRNKHWRYISSYHGPWLQLPIELLESLLAINLESGCLPQAEGRLPAPTSSNGSDIPQRTILSPDASSPSPTRDPSPDATDPEQTPKPLKPTPPPIDPGVFRCMTAIRRLVEEASDLAVRASSGMSAAAFGSFRSASASIGGGSANAWTTAQQLGINPMNEQGGSGRNVQMSAMRAHRLRALAVQKLAAAYKEDEIAASVMIMQGASALDDLAEKVLKIDPKDEDARYVHFFHEKIPSRQLAETTTTQVLDELINARPHHLEYFRTRGIIRCFRDEYSLAIRDFTYALKETRALRKSKHHSTPAEDHRLNPKKKKKSAPKVHGQAPPDGTAALGDDADPPPTPMHPSLLPDSPEPLEHQLLFLRGAAYLQQAMFLVEEAILALEGVRKTSFPDGGEFRLCYIENGKHGGVEIGHPDGPLGFREGEKLKAYRGHLASEPFKEQIDTLLKKSIRDHERFLSHFDTIEGPRPIFQGDLAQRTEYAFLLSEALRPGSQSPAPPVPDAPASFTTYHPLLVESHFNILICNLLQGDFSMVLSNFARAAALVDGLEGYPVFLPARSMVQAEFIEALERLASGWRAGIQPHSLSSKRLRIEAPASVAPAPASPSSSGRTTPSLGSASTPNVKSSANGLNGAAKETIDPAEALDCARILLAPVLKRQRERAASKAAADKAGGTEKKKPVSINIPLHGPRVEIILAWLGAVHLPVMEGYA